MAASLSSSLHATRNVEKEAEEYARRQIEALLNGSDDEDDEVPEEAGNFRISPLLSSSSVEKASFSNQVDLDLDLDDEAVAAPEASADDGKDEYTRLMEGYKARKQQQDKPVAAIEPSSRSPVPSQQHQESAPSPPAVPAETSAEEDDARLPTRKPKHKRLLQRRNRARTPTPERSSPPPPTAAARSSSPKNDLFVSPARSASAGGLFVSPRASPSPRKPRQRSAASEDDEDDDMPTSIPAQNPRLQKLVAKMRAEREAREEAERAKIESRRQQQAQREQQLSDIYSSELNDGTTEQDRSKITENSRPTQRKASRKALEEMNRETQRMARNMQLSHQARVKRRITTMDFLKDVGIALSSEDGHAKAGLESSDHEDHDKQERATPASSPPPLGNLKDSTRIDDEDEYIIRTGPEADSTEDPELPDLQTLLSDPIRPLQSDKGKGRASEADMAANHQTHKRQIRVIPPQAVDHDSDDDLQILSARKPSRFAVFDNLPKSEIRQSAPLLNLRALAHVSPPSKHSRHPRNHKGLTSAQLQLKLAEQMRAQILAEKQEKLEELRARGIVFKTEEELEEDQMFIENALEKARKEAMELGLKEKERAKKEGKEIDENYQLPSDDESEDGDFEGGEQADEEEDEEMRSGSEDDEEVETGIGGILVDDAAAEDGPDSDTDFEDAIINGDDKVVIDAAGDEGHDLTPTVSTKLRSRPRARNVVLDEEDEDQNQAEPQPETPALVARTQDHLHSQHTSPVFEAFGFAVPNGSDGLGLTQMFQGTMAEMEVATPNDTGAARSLSRSATQPDLAFLRDASIPSPRVSVAAGAVVPNSQTVFVTPRKPAQHIEMTPTLRTPAITSQMSPMKQSQLIPDPTQDAGFESVPSSMRPMDMPQEPGSTIDTVLLSNVPAQIVGTGSDLDSDGEAVPLRKKGKLRRRQIESAEPVESSGQKPPGNDDFELTNNAFDALFKAAKKPVTTRDFDKKRSEAKTMFEEQAEESEDEYAGLGGASDDESDNEAAAEEMREMIDEGPVDVKEGELAKLFADRDRAEDEKRVDKLYRDITTGALRRKRAVGMDELSDEDSDDEIAERRRQKQREFAKMRKALLEDENVGKIAENPKKLAFLRAIEDRDEEEGMDFDFDDEVVPASQTVDDPEQQQELAAEVAAAADPAVAANMSLKRKLPAAFGADQGKDNIVPAPNMSHRRRPAADDAVYKKPKTLAEMRRTISSLIDDENAVVPASQFSDAEDDNEDDDLEIEGMNSRRSEGVLTAVRASVVNRLTLSRQSTVSESDVSVSGAVAFHTSTSSTAALFKVPSLLRRATTNLSTTSNTTETRSGTTTPTTGEGNGVRRGGSKKSNIHFQAREAERRKKVLEAEERRKEAVRRRVVGGGRGGLLGMGSGGFE